MELLQKKRREKRFSQRKLASLAGVSFRTIQLIESGKHDAKISTLQRLVKSLGYPPKIIERSFANIIAQPSDSIAMISERIIDDGASSWKIWLFNFVDAFRGSKDPAYIIQPPAKGLPARINALIASVVETLCAELDVEIPSWCAVVPPLKEPWFVSDTENLKASALLESPVHFRKRNIFVLDNFLSRR